MWHQPEPFRGTKLRLECKFIERPSFFFHSIHVLIDFDYWTHSQINKFLFIICCACIVSLYWFYYGRLVYTDTPAEIQYFIYRVVGAKCRYKLGRCNEITINDNFNAPYARYRIKLVAFEQRTWSLILRETHYFVWVCRWYSRWNEFL